MGENSLHFYVIFFVGVFFGGRNATFCIFNVIFCRRRVRVTQVPKSSSHCCLLLPGGIWSLARLVDSWPVATFIRSSKIFWRSLHFVKLTARPWKKGVGRLLSLLRRLVFRGYVTMLVLGRVVGSQHDLHVHMPWENGTRMRFVFQIGVIFPLPLRAVG